MREAPANVPTATHRHRVAFFETDAMGIVHHSNYLRFFEMARVVYLESHDQPYPAYVELGLHFATTNAQIDYHRSARFDDMLDVMTWLEQVGGASLRMVYRVERSGQLIASGATEHAAVDSQGRVRRIPRERREHLRGLATDPDASRAGARRRPR